MAELRNILAIYDPARAARLAEQPAVKRATAIAKAAGAGLELFLCDYNQYLSGERFFDSPGLKKAREAFIEGRHKAVKKVAAEIEESGVSITTNAVWDSPLSDGIVREVIRRAPDLVVKETHTHARLQRAVFTNTDWHLLRDCPAPLLLIKRETSPKGPIVVAVDPMHDNDKPAVLDHHLIEFGQMLARLEEKGMHLFHAYHTIAPMPSGVPVGIEPVALPVPVSEEQIRQAHEREFGALAAKFGIRKDHTHLQQGITHDLLLDLVESLGASTLIMGAVSRGLVKRLFIGSTAERVLGDVGCDVLVIKPPGFQSPVHS